MKNPRVSIIIPTYNRASYLSQAIESSLALEYSNLEVIVSDNASTDNTKEVAVKYTNDSRFKYFRNETNLGLAANWRRALYDYATGDWALILSDDDYLTDTLYISKAVSLAKSDRGIVLVFANHIISYKACDVVKCSNIKLPALMDGRWAFWNYWTKTFVGINLLTAFFNRNKALELDAFGRDIIGPDTELWFKLLLVGKVGFIKDVVAGYRLHETNQVLQVDLDKRFKNHEGIREGANFARSLGLNEYEVGAWQKRITGISLKNTLSLVLDRGKRKDLIYFIVCTYGEELKYLSLFFEFKIAVKVILFLVNPGFLRAILSLYWKLSKKSTKSSNS